MHNLAAAEAERRRLRGRVGEAALEQVLRPRSHHLVARLTAAERRRSVDPLPGERDPALPHGIVDEGLGSARPVDPGAGCASTTAQVPANISCAAAGRAADSASSAQATTV